MSQHPSEPRSLWRPVALVVALGIALFAALAGVIFWLNSTVYSANAFVADYLNHVANDDVASAIAKPGVMPSAAELAAQGLPANTSTALLRTGTATTLPRDIRIVSDAAHSDGSHNISASYRLGNEIRTTAFSVKPAPPLYGLIPRWAFAKSPLAPVLVKVAHDAIFSVGSLDLDIRAQKAPAEYTDFSQSGAYLAVAPATYSLSRTSDLLSAQPVTVATQPGLPVTATLDAQPTTAFVDRVQTQVAAFLDACVKQHVLQPTGCPFGVTIDDRVIGDPEWTIVNQPKVSIAASDTGFQMPDTPAKAHVDVQVQSLFDGTRKIKRVDVDFTMRLSARIRSDGSLAITLEGEPTDR